MAPPSLQPEDASHGDRSGPNRNAATTKGHQRVAAATTQERIMNLFKSLILATSALAASAAYSQNYPEGSYPPVPDGALTDRAVVAQEAKRWNQAGRPGLVVGEGRPEFTPVFDEASSVRADVRADRDQWVGAGLADLNRGEATPDFGAPAYRAGVTRYEQATESKATVGGARASVKSFGATTIGN
jgi:hypothetical protein